MLEKKQKRYRRHRKIRAKISGTSKVPRLCVFRSANHIYAQLINDEKGVTIATANDLELKKGRKKTSFKDAEIKGEKKTRKVDVAYQVGKLIAEKALAKKVEKVVFDRGGYAYLGKVKALAEGAREGGLRF